MRALFSLHLLELRALPDPELDADMSDFPSAYRGPSDGFLLAEIGPRLVGMCGLRGGEIRRLYVVHEHRGQGIAERLVFSLLDRHEGPFFAIVADGNQPAHRFFRRMGFFPTGERPSHPKMRHCSVLRNSSERGGN